MKIIWLAILLSCGMSSAARAEWTHKGSGISLPDQIGDMRRGEERDLSRGERVDVAVQYGTDADPVTLYVYRSSHPNPALWFDRVRVAMIDNVGRFEPGTPRPFTLGAGAQPNGLREEFAVTGKQWKASSVALAQNGEWIIKARVTSTSLDEAGVGARMDRLLAAIRLEAVREAPLPLRAPTACTSSASFTGTTRSGESAMAIGAVMGVVAMADARGSPTGLSGKPDEWCRDDPTDALMRKMASVYRRRDGSGWTALLGDSGMSAQALNMMEMQGSKGAALYFTRTGPTALVQMYDALPSLEQAMTAIAPVLRGQAKPMATIGINQKKP